jgi:large subunit ribosomal protein L4
LSDEEDACARSFRNIQSVSVLPASDAGVADVVGAASLVVSSAALERLEQTALESKAKS